MKKLLIIVSILAIAVFASAFNSRIFYKQLQITGGDIMTYVNTANPAHDTDFSVSVTDVATGDIVSTAINTANTVRVCTNTGPSGLAAWVIFNAQGFPTTGNVPQNRVFAVTLTYNGNTDPLTNFISYNVTAPSGTGAVWQYGDNSLFLPLSMFGATTYTLGITSNYAGATILKDNVTTGQVTPWTFDPAEAGTYTVQHDNVVWTTAPYVYAATANETVHFVGVMTPDPAMTPFPTDLAEIHIPWDAAASTYNLTWAAPATGPAPTGYYLVWNGAPQVDLGNVLTWTTPAIAEGAYTWKVTPYITDPAKGSTRDMGPVKATIKTSAPKGASTTAVDWHFTIIRDAQPTTTFTLTINGPVGTVITGPAPSSIVYTLPLALPITDSNDTVNDLAGEYTAGAAPAGTAWVVNPITPVFVDDAATISFVADPIDVTIPSDPPPPGLTIVTGGVIPSELLGPDAGVPAVIYTVTYTGTHDVTVLKPAQFLGDWYCWIQAGAMLYPAANPIPAATMSWLFTGINFDAKGPITIIINDEATLPVELSSFSAILTAQNFVKLTWVTESETNMNGYNVYRNETADYAAATHIGYQASTNSSTQHVYSHTDNEVETNNTYYYWLECVDFNGTSTLYGPQFVTVVGNDTPNLPTVTTLNNAYPNPFKTSTTIAVDVKEGENATVTIYNILGQAVMTYRVPAGTHNLNWNGRDSKGNACGSGIYFYKLTSPTMNQTKKMVIVK